MFPHLSLKFVSAVCFTVCCRHRALIDVCRRLWDSDVLMAARGGLNTFRGVCVGGGVFLMRDRPEVRLSSAHPFVDSFLSILSPYL